jgi:phosphonate transport system ATP-binding protein
VVSALLFNLKNMDLAYKDLIVLRQVNLQIEKGEKIVLAGPSGAGKTTLLKKLYQLRPQECGFIQQHFAIVKQLSVIDNIHLKRLDHSPIFLRLINFIKFQKRKVKKILPILQTIGLEEKMSAKAGELSDEQQQRLSVGRAIYQNHPILLADEPVAAMASSQAEVILRALINTENTIIMALHSVELTLKYAQRIVGLSAGQIRFDLPKEQVTSDHITDLYLNDNSSET